MYQFNDDFSDNDLVEISSDYSEVFDPMLVDPHLNRFNIKQRASFFRMSSDFDVYERRYQNIVSQDIGIFQKFQQDYPRIYFDNQKQIDALLFFMYDLFKQTRSLITEHLGWDVMSRSEIITYLRKKLTLCRICLYGDDRSSHPLFYLGAIDFFSRKLSKLQVSTRRLAINRINAFLDHPKLESLVMKKKK